MELLWLFGMSTNAYAWFVVIVSFIISILLAVALSRDSNDWYYDFFGIPRPIEFSDEIDELTIEIVKEKTSSEGESPKESK